MLCDISTVKLLKAFLDVCLTAVRLLLVGDAPLSKKDREWIERIVHVGEGAWYKGRKSEASETSVSCMF